MDVRRRAIAIAFVVPLGWLGGHQAATGPITTPESAIRFYQQSVNRGLCPQAYKLIGLGSPRIDMRKFLRQCEATKHLDVTIVDPDYRIKRLNASYSCLGVLFSAHLRDGTVRTSGGWYLLEKTPYLFWHVLLARSHIARNGGASAPSRATCAAAIPSYASPSSAQLITGDDFLSPATAWIAVSRSGSYVPNGSCGHGIGTNCNTAQTVIYRTDDGGAHWRKELKLTTSPGPPIVIRFFNNQVGLVAATTGWTNSSKGSVAHAVLLRTDDGGMRWRRLRFPAGYAPDPPTFTFPDPKHGWFFIGGAAAGSMGVTIYATGNGGRRWSKVACTEVPGYSGLCHVDSGIGFGGDKEFLTFSNDRDGWLTVYSNVGTPALLYTSDGGRMWRDQHVGLPPGVKVPTRPNQVSPMGTLDVPHIFGRIGILPEVVDFYRPKSRGSWSRLYLFRSTDGGASWHFYQKTPIASPSIDQSETSEGTFSTLVNARDWFFVSGKSIWRTTNEGTTWMHHPMRIPAILHLLSMRFLNRTDGWAEAVPPEKPGAMLGATALLRTTDGGRHWQRVDVPSNP